MWNFAESVHGYHRFLKRICDQQWLRIPGLIDLQILIIQLGAILWLCAFRNVIHLTVQQSLLTAYQFLWYGPRMQKSIRHFQRDYSPMGEMDSRTKRPWAPTDHPPSTLHTGLSPCAASRLAALTWEWAVTPTVYSSDLHLLDEKPHTLQEPWDPTSPSFPALPGASWTLSGPALRGSELWRHWWMRITPAH